LEIRCERNVKSKVIDLYRREVVLELMKSTAAPLDRLRSANYRAFEAEMDIIRWSTDPEAQKAIEERLAAAGYDEASVIAAAYMRGATKSRPLIEDWQPTSSGVIQHCGRLATETNTCLIS
jgi:hypothetical protein